VVEQDLPQLRGDVDVEHLAQLSSCPQDVGQDTHQLGGDWRDLQHRDIVGISSVK
jgi:hypothetical protein